MIGPTLVLALLLAAAPDAAATPGQSPVDPAACFGGTPEIAVRAQAGASDLRVDGGKLYWVAGGELRAAELATGKHPGEPGKELTKIATLGRTSGARALDARSAVDVSATNQLWALDRATRQRKVIFDGRPEMEVALVVSSIGLHGDHVYYGRTAPDFRWADEAGFFRVRRDGKGAAERLALAPDGETPFVVTGGMVVWPFAEDKDRVIVRRRPAGQRVDMTLEIQALRKPPYRPRGSGIDLVRLVGDQLFFVFRNGIWSAPADGRTPAVRRVPVAWEWRGGNQDEPVDLTTDGRCAYWSTHGAIKRARLDAAEARRPETIVPEDQVGGESVATDGAYLYWASRDGHIMRSGPSAAPRSLRPPLAARPAAAQTKQPFGVGELVVDDDFGCALLGRGAKERTWRCWRLPTATPPAAGGGAVAPEPFEVPGLDGRTIATGFGRFCAGDDANVRCATAREVFERRGAVPAAPPTTAGAGGEGGGGRASKESGQLLVGADFTCWLQGFTLTCAGDNRFGQRASGDGAATAATTGAAWHAAGGSVGAWHGCLRTMQAGSSCWGRNDAGQLGHVSPGVCQVGGQQIPCSRSPQKTAVPEGAWNLMMGDLFTCATDSKRLWCWGASRDGAFGKAEDCPPELRRAWPARTGAVAAPQATCARAPVEIAGFGGAAGGRGEQVSFAVGPRGLCAATKGKVQCQGAIPTPRFPPDQSPSLRRVLVSAGDRPSACVADDGGLDCWGSGYSPESDPGRPVRITFREGVEGGAPVVDFPAPAPAGWPEECLVHRACVEAAAPLPACDGKSAAPPVWAELAPRAASLVGTTVSVRGALNVGPPELHSCNSRSCCTSTGVRAIVLGAVNLDADDLLRVGALGCHGDDSRLCCQAPAYGQTVRAVGKLAPAAGGYRLDQPSLCQERAP